jgi:tetratricopeptide (TPR) repeat protein
MHPSQINQQMSFARKLQAEKKYQQAEVIYKNLLAVTNHPDILHIYATLLLETTRFIPAINVIHSALKMNPNNAHYLNTLGIAYRRNNQLHDAIKQFKASIEISPLVADAYLNLGMTYRQMKSWSLALQNFKQGIGLNKKNPSGYLNLGNLYRERQEWDLAIDYYQQALEQNSNYIQAHYNIALVQRDQGLLDLSLSGIEGILSKFPQYLSANMLKGELLEHLGKIAEAAAQYRYCLKIEAHNASPYWSLANLGSGNFSPDEVLEMKSLLKTKLPISQQVYLLFSLAKALEEIKEYKEAFQFLLQGNEMKYAALPVKSSSHSIDIKAISSFFCAKNINDFNKGSSSQLSPIFILGMPRSGTSLIEQIIASHSQVSGGGELTTAEHLLFDYLPKQTALDWQGAFDELDEKLLTELADIYYNNHRELIDSNQFFTDKLPFNFALIGFLSMVFPRAKFVHIYKNPIDSCLGCFKQLFTVGQEFSYQLDSLADYYVNYHQLMQHWNKIMPARIHHVSYESLIESPDENITNLLTFLNIPWEDDCHKFHTSTRVVTTASSGQVRAPIYKTAVKRWKCYEPYLGTLIEKLPASVNYPNN